MPRATPASSVATAGIEVKRPSRTWLGLGSGLGSGLGLGLGSGSGSGSWLRFNSGVGLRLRVRVRATATARAVVHRVVQRPPGRVGHHEAGRLLHARSVQPDHVRVAHARESTHLPAHGLGDGAQRRLARLALVAAALLLDRDGQSLQEVRIGLWAEAADWSVRIGLRAEAADGSEDALRGASSPATGRGRRPPGRRRRPCCRTRARRTQASKPRAAPSPRASSARHAPSRPGLWTGTPRRSSFGPPRSWQRRPV